MRGISTMYSAMATATPVELYIGMSLLLLLLQRTAIPAAASEVTVTATAPVATIEEGGVLSLHCQIWNLDVDQSVVILRQLESGAIEKLSHNKNVMAVASDMEEERIYVAYRQLDDASFVYFLSIIGVRRTDAGQYSCKVLSASMESVDARAQVFIGVYYTPGEPFPHCSAVTEHGEDKFGIIAMPLYAGTKMSLNCSSEHGVPDVKLEWRRSNDEELGHGEILRNAAMLSSLVTITLTEKDNGMVFVCTGTSIADVEYSKTCHIGPLEVLPNPNGDRYDDNTNLNGQEEGPNDNELQDTGLSDILDGNIVVRPPSSSSKCRQLCSQQSQYDEYYWIIATVCTGTFAVVMLLTLAILFWRYSRRISRQQQERQMYLAGNSSTLQTHRADDIYEKLEFRSTDNDGGGSGTKMMYMALQRPVVDNTGLMRESSEFVLPHHQTILHQVEGTATLERYS